MVSSWGRKENYATSSANLRIDAGRFGIVRFFLNSYLLAGISASGDDGDSADLEELHFVLPVGGRYVLGRVRDFVVNRTVIGNLVQNLGFVGCRFGASDSQVLCHVAIAFAYLKRVCARASLLLIHHIRSRAIYLLPSSSPHQQLE